VKDESPKALRERLLGLVAGADLEKNPAKEEAKSKARRACAMLLNYRVTLVDPSTTAALLAHIQNGEVMEACKLVRDNGSRIQMRPSVAALLSAASTFWAQQALMREHGMRLLYKEDRTRALFCEDCGRQILHGQPGVVYVRLAPPATTHFPPCPEDPFEFPD
jgi:hypothetical protein